MSELEYQSNESIHASAGTTTSVNHIVIEIYDHEYGFTNVINRFVAKHDTLQMVDILKSHLSGEVISSNGFELQVIEGLLIERWAHVDKRPFMLGFDTW